MFQLNKWYLDLVADDGTAFVGFQRQTNGPTIQAAVETALGRIGWGET